jgi:hypothetical protein
MKVHNSIPLLLECLNRWKTCPSEKQFMAEYADPQRAVIGDFFDDFHEDLEALNWVRYRENALKLDADFEAKRFQQNLELVEELFQFRLSGETFLIGTFEVMDGFARFERGNHKVFLGLDEGHLQGRYLDVLTTHELTHVARESRPEVWEGFGLDPKMSRADFLEYQPVVEHVLGEGFSCAVSEILVPGEAHWSYTYQTRESLEQVYKNAATLDRLIKKEIENPDGDYGKLYGIRPVFSQYVWGCEWVKQLLRDHAGGLPRNLVNRCAKDFLADAHAFQLNRG